MVDDKVEQVVIDTVRGSSSIDDSMAPVVLEALELGASTYGGRGNDKFKGIEDNILSLQETLSEWNMMGYDNAAIGYAAYMTTTHSLTNSEMKALAFIADKGHFAVDCIERRETPDFVANGKYGIEVKSNENYSLSRKQLLSVEELSPFHIYLSTRTGVELLDVVDWIGLNEYETIGGN